MGNFIAWDAKTGKIVWSFRSSSRCGPGALATAGGVVFYGTLEGYLKAVDAKTGKELYKFKTPSGIIGNVTTYEHGGKQYIAILSGVGGWAGIGLAAGLTKPTDGLGAVGGYAALKNYTSLGGQLTVFALPEADPERSQAAPTSCPARRSRRRVGLCFGTLRHEHASAEDMLVRQALWPRSCSPRAVCRRRGVALGGRFRRSGGRQGVRTASISTRRAIRPTRSAPTARSIGTPIPASAAITPTAMCATAPTAKARLMRRR